MTQPDNDSVDEFAEPEPQRDGGPGNPSERVRTSPSPTVGSAPPQQVATPVGLQRRRFYAPVLLKFSIAFLLAGVWMTIGIVLSLPWLRELSGHLSFFPALIAIALMAYLPGHLMSFMFFSLVLDKQPPFRDTAPTTALTVVIAARNEADAIEATLEALAAQDYRGHVTTVLADNGSSDATSVIAREVAARLGLDLSAISEQHPGKSYALNTALATVTTCYVITLDADTRLHPQALTRIVARLESSPADVVAVAGSIMVANVGSSFWTRMQGWDYFLAIASIKRMQGMYSSTLVAQGAFSLYRTAKVKAVGGWPDAIGEDIVLTWRLLEDGSRVIFEPTAVALTNVPVTLHKLARQRSRWARGMVEALNTIKPWRLDRGLTKPIAAIDLAIPWLDLGYTVVWIPGFVLALFGVYWIVGLWTLMVLPVTMLIYGTLAYHQYHRVAKPLGLQTGLHWYGLLAFVLFYQLIMSPVALAGYVQEIIGLRRRWK